MVDSFSKTLPPGKPGKWRADSGTKLCSKRGCSHTRFDILSYILIFTVSTITSAIYFLWCTEADFWEQVCFIEIEGQLKRTGFTKDSKNTLISRTLKVVKEPKSLYQLLKSGQMKTE